MLDIGNTHWQHTLATHISDTVLSILQDAAHWLMDQDDLENSEASWYARQEQLQRDAEQAARQEKANRKQLLDKYHLQPVPTCAHTHLHTRSVQAPKSKSKVPALPIILTDSTKLASVVTTCYQCCRSETCSMCHAEPGTLQRRCCCYW